MSTDDVREGGMRDFTRDVRLEKKTRLPGEQGRRGGAFRHERGAG